MYQEVNDALNAVFLSGRFEGRPLYLVLDDKGRRELARRLGIGADEVESSCCEAVGAYCSPIGNPYAPFEGPAKTWLRSGAVEAPPFTGLLYALSHAAELMVSDEEFSSGNYYRRLEQAIGVPYARLSHYGAKTVEFWNSFSDWLSLNDYALGRPTARSSGHFKYVSLPISQAIVREAERSLLHRMFAKFNFSGSEALSADEIEHYIGSWLSASGANQRLRSAWNKLELRPHICEVALSELEEYSGALEGEPGAAAGSSTMSMVVAAVRDALGRKLVISIGKEASVEGDMSLTAKGEDSARFEIANSVYGNFATVGPRRALEIDRILVSGADFRSIDGKVFRWKERLVVPFRKSDNGPYWIETRRVSMGETHCVLVRDTKGTRAQVEEILEQSATPGFTVATPDQLPGLPRDWLFYERVQLLRALGDVPVDFSALVPLSDSGKIELEEGVKLGRNIWHRWKPPLVVLQALGGTFEIKVFEGSNSDGDLIYDAASLSGTAQLNLSTITIPTSGALHVTAGRVGEPPSTATFLLRSGLRPRPLDRAGEGLLEYRSIWSAAPSTGAADAEPAVRGNVTRFEQADPTSFLLPAGLASSGGRGAVEQQTPNVEERTADPVCKGKPKSSEELIAEFNSKTCVERGKHLWVFPAEVPRYSSFLKTCTSCGEISVSKRAKAVRYSPNKRGAAPHPVPAPPPPAPRSQAHIDEDLVLDALCFLGSGSRGDFERLVVTEIEEPWEAQRLLKDLVTLGHVDVVLESGTGRTREWCVAPPALAFYAEDEAVLSGYRNVEMLADAVDLLEHSGARWERKERDDQPLVYRFKGISPGEAKEALSVLRDPHNRAIAVVDHVPERLSTACQQLGRDSPLLPATIGRPDYLQCYDVESGKWRRAESASKKGAYRYQLGGMEYAYIDEAGQAWRGPHELVKTLAARQAGKSVHAYDPELLEFSSRLGCEPPGLPGRLLVSCSGELPMVGEGQSVFSNVPPHVAACVFKLLYQDGDLT